jgi:hypothetical protein
VVDVREPAELALEAQQRVRFERAQRLQRDPPAALVVDGLVDHPHAAAPDHPPDLETAGA